MSIAPDVVATIAVAAAAVSGVLLIALVVVALRLRGLSRRYRDAVGEDGTRQDLVQAVATQARSIEQLAADLRTVHGNTELLRDLQRGAVSRVGLVRYDAFPDMGGMLSFSAALLDERGDGVVISAINGRQETRAYAKPLADGDSDHTLSDEERAAVKAAVDGGGGDVLASPGKGRRRS